MANTYPTSSPVRPISRRAQGFPAGRGSGKVIPFRGGATSAPPGRFDYPGFDRPPARRTIPPHGFSKYFGRNAARKSVLTGVLKGLGRLHPALAGILLAAEVANWFSQGDRNFANLTPTGWAPDPTCAANTNCTEGQITHVGLCPAICGSILTWTSGITPYTPGDITFARTANGGHDFLGRPKTIFGQQYIYTPPGTPPVPSVNVPQPYIPFKTRLRRRQRPWPRVRQPRLPKWLPRRFPELAPPGSPEPHPSPPPIPRPAQRAQPRGRRSRNPQNWKPNNPRPPGKRVREKKGRMTRALMRLIGFATEFLDWTSAAFGALPQDLIDELYRRNRGFPSWQDKAEYTYKNWARVDLWQFAVNVSKQEIGDLLIGTGARATGVAPGYGVAYKGPSSRLKEEWDDIRKDVAFEQEIRDPLGKSPLEAQDERHR